MIDVGVRFFFFRSSADVAYTKNIYYENCSSVNRTEIGYFLFVQYDSDITPRGIRRKKVTVAGTSVPKGIFYSRPNVGGRRAVVSVRNIKPPRRRRHTVRWSPSETYKARARLRYRSSRVWIFHDRLFIYISHAGFECVRFFREQRATIDFLIFSYPCVHRWHHWWRRT